MKDVTIRAAQGDILIVRSGGRWDRPHMMIHYRHHTYFHSSDVELLPAGVRRLRAACDEFLRENDPPRGAKNAKHDN